VEFPGGVIQAIILQKRDIIGFFSEVRGTVVQRVSGEVSTGSVLISCAAGLITFCTAVENG
jgi:hypothetical protein